jgi:hypothetical protein
MQLLGFLSSPGGDETAEDERSSTNVPSYADFWAWQHQRSPDALEDDNSLIDRVNLGVMLATRGQGSLTG